MCKFSTLAMVSMVFLTATASAQQPVSVAPSVHSPTAKPTVSDKLICRSEETTGSRFSKKVCHTKAEWNAMSAEGAAALEASRRPH